MKCSGTARPNKDDGSFTVFQHSVGDSGSAPRLGSASAGSVAGVTVAEDGIKAVGASQWRHSTWRHSRRSQRALYSNAMKVFLFVLAATVLEATGDSVVRIALHHASWSVRIGLFALGALLLTLYGTSLNLAPVEFAQVTGLYVATLFVVFQITNYVFFHAPPTMPVSIGGFLIVSGGLVIAFWR